MKSGIMLLNNKGYQWFEKQGIAVKGYAFDKDDNFLEEGSLASFFSGINSLDELEKVVQGLNGLFALVLESKEATYLACDITRTFPLFYIQHDNKWIVSDDANYIEEKYKPKFNKNVQQEFLCAGYVTGNQTLLEGVKQVQSAEIVELKKESAIAKEYWTYATNKTTDKSFETLQTELLAIYERVANRLIASAKGKTIVIPLSGGYDSRFIAVMLKKIGYDNVVCYTYGKYHCFEAKRSRKIAQTLGFDWVFIDYTEEIIEKYFKRKYEWDEYTRLASNYCSIPHIQDFLAVLELKLNKKIPKNSMIVPGHSGDIFAGTHIPKNIEKLDSHESYKAVMYKKHFHYCTKELDIKFFIKNIMPHSFFESWSWKERQSKFIVNSVRAYDYCDYKYSIPLWDKELAEFFRTVPLYYKNRQNFRSYKKNINLYDSVATTYFKEANVNFKKKFFENFLQRAFCKVFGYCINKDCLNFYKIGQYFSEEVKHKSINAKVIHYTNLLLRSKEDQ